MHELSFAIEIGRIAEEKLRETAPQLVTVAVDVGDEAGVEPANLEFCLEAVFAYPPFTGAKPLILPCTGDILRVAYLEIDDGCPDD